VGTCRELIDYNVSYSGQTCTDTAPTPAPAPPAESTAPVVPAHQPKCAAGEGVLTSDTGTVACVPAGVPDTRTPIYTETKTVETFPDGSTKTTTTGTTTDPGTGATATNTTSTSTGGLSGTAGTTTTSSGTSSGTGEGGGAGGECEEHPTTIGCSEYGTPTEGDALGSKSVGTSSLTPPISSSGSCPADINLPRGMKFSWEWACMYASGIRPVVIALAWLSAGLFLFGMRLD